ncbi:hypothetical protein [Cryobacterium sp. SO1]|uniref:hypothetical protein n=1 Tax=Cryobacterium sp. SO1 TaxID=1897061 RepID=UPI001022AC5A|nr:hypothetical protein [Cryobacterium sp. SO1]RZI35319.1 hypothetical protein BJQ95_02386 [Cryobacterium sp. SO1]
MNNKGIGAVAKGAWMLGSVDAIAHRIAQVAGPGFEVSTRRGKSRAVSSVYSATDEAKKAEAENRALTRAIDAGRSS